MLLNVSSPWILTVREYCVFVKINVVEHDSLAEDITKKKKRYVKKTDGATKGLRKTQVDTSVLVPRSESGCSKMCTAR